jgi:hypothetical protein
MTTFKEIRGTTIEVVSTDPTNPEVGQIWYNSSSGTLKGYALGNVNAWAAGGNVNTARGGSGTSGTQTAGLFFAGGTNGPVVPTGATESYNGTSWTSVTSMNTARYWPGSANAGTQNATLAFGGATVTNSESYNGTSWTNTPSLNTARYGGGGAGTQTAALLFGGTNPGYFSATESYNGSSWTTVNSLNTPRGYLAGCGLQTAALGAGGYGPGNLSAVEKYNGSTWTTVTSLNTARYALGLFGIQTASIAFGGSGASSYLTNTESYNGTSWTNNPTGLATGRFRASGLGSQTQGLAVAGKGPPTSYITNTEEWTGVALATQTITVS